MKSKQVATRPAIEVELQKLKLGALSQDKNMELEYNLLRMLNQIVTHNLQIVNTPTFALLFQQLVSFQEIQNIKMLPLFQNFCYQLWTNQKFNIEIRQKTDFFRIVSNWIAHFQHHSGKTEKPRDQFAMIEDFMVKETKTFLERVVMIEETFEDLKDLLEEQFWNQEQIEEGESTELQLLGKRAQPNLQKAEAGEQSSKETLETITKVLSILQGIVNPQFYRVKTTEKLYKNCTYAETTFTNVNDFIKKSIYYILKQPSVPSHIQTQLSKISLIHMQSLSTENSRDIVNLLKHLMAKTSKAVRFSLVFEYVQFYEFLQKMGYQQIIDEVEKIVNFRQLIIGKKIVQQNLTQIGNKMNESKFSYNQLHVKAGTSKKIYFSNQTNDTILKLDVLLAQNDITIKICHYDNLVLERGNFTTIHKMVFETVNALNYYDRSKINDEKIYWKEQRSASKKLQLKLKYQGLFSIEFDNYYSWVLPKDLKYRLELFRPLL